MKPKEPDAFDALQGGEASEDGDKEWYEADGGKLSHAGRRAAIESSLSLIGVYFSQGKKTDLEDRSTVQRSDQVPSGTEVLLAALRLRTAIAASHKLSTLLMRINKRANFKYTANKVESVGRVMGRLDVLSYSRRIGRVNVPPTYPVIDVRRGLRTPENTLAYSAGLLILRELNAIETLDVFPSGGPEHREARTAVSRIRRQLQMPALFACRAEAHETIKFNALLSLNSRVRRRVDAGHVGNPTPYLELTDWVAEILSGQPIAKVGDIDWSFYGSDFDTKLYELWCLNLLGTVIAERLLLISPSVGGTWRSGGPVYAWRRPAGLIELRFQQSLQHLTAGDVRPRWSRMKNAGGSRIALGGIPDIVAKTIHADGSEQLVILDPKLRQRNGTPTEELYKLLGYFENYGLRSNPQGAILFYTTAMELPQYHFGLKNGEGALLAVGLNPAELSSSKKAVQPVVELILNQLGITVSAPEDSAPLMDDTAIAETVIRTRLDELKQFSAILGMSLNASKDRMEMVLGESYWQSLTEDVQVMMATAEHVGFTMDPNGDFSAAILGLCTGLESLLDDALVSPVRAAANGLQTHYTFGQTVQALEVGLAGKGNAFAIALKQQVDEMKLDIDACTALAGKLSRVNKEYRNPAAHKTSLTQAVWRSAWRDMVGEGALYRQIIDVFMSGRYEPSTAPTKN